MDNNLKFGINFDLDEGAKRAQEDAKKFLDRMKLMIDARPLAIKLDTSSVASGSISDIKSRIKALQKEWNDLAEAQRIEDSSTGKLTTRAQALKDEYARLTTALKTYGQTLNQVERAAEQQAKAAQRAAEQQAKAQEKASINWQTTGGHIQKQETYVSRLVKRMAVYFAYSQAVGFLSKIREITAEFELQRVSLGAIIQDQTKANALFSEIKTFALQSPVSVLDLTKYTKQLAAYKIGYDELFDTTKRLTDVSVGLGVSMDRIVLLYGQIRATGYLRASEVRQATEAGIPLVEELAKKLTAANGELVRASDVMDMISKRQISFDMVKDVFDDMTSKGGMFYDMQIKQGNTLFGLWAKLGDAAQIMFDEIGNTEGVNSAMKWLIELATSLMRNWDKVAKTLGYVAAAFVAVKVATMAARASAFAYTAAGKQHLIQATQTVVALQAEQAAMTKASVLGRLYAKQQLAVATAQLRAAQATNLFSKSLYKLKAAFLSNPFGWAILAITALVELFSSLSDAAEEAKEEADLATAQITQKYAKKDASDEFNFNRLANEAVNAADGSKKQKDALDELNRTYGEIVGSQNLQIEKLREMRGAYQSLTEMIKAYNETQRKQEADAAIKDAFGTAIKDAQKEVLEDLTDIGFNDAMSGELTSFILENAAKLDKDAMTAALTEKIKSYYSKEQIEDLGFIFDDWTSRILDDYDDLHSALSKQDAALTKNENTYKENMKALNEYKMLIDSLKKAVESGDWSTPDAIQENRFLSIEAGESGLHRDEVRYDPSKVEGEYAKYAETINAQLQTMFASLRSMANNEGIALSKEFFTAAESWVTSGKTEFSMFNWDAVSEAVAKGSPKLQAAFQMMKDMQETLLSSDPAVRQIQQHLIVTAENVGIVGKAFGRLRQYLWDGNTDLKEHVKNLEDIVAAYEADIIRMTAAMNNGTWLAKQLYGQKVEETKTLVSALKEQIAFEKKYLPQTDKPSRSGGRKSDDRLQRLRSMQSELDAIYKRYEQLRKAEGETAALEHINKIYDKQLQRINKMGKAFGLAFEMPTSFDKIQAANNKILGAVDKLRGKVKDAEKEGISLSVKIGNLDVDEVAKQLKEQLATIADRISRSKEMQDFYDKILDLTGSVSRAEGITKSIFGDTGADLPRLMAEEIRKIVGSVNAVELPDGIINAYNIVNFKALREFAEKNKKELGDMYKKLIKITNDGQKQLANAYQGYLGDLKVAETYAYKRVKLARETAAKIAEINKQAAAGNITTNEAAQLTEGYRRREQEEQAKIEWEAFKDLPYYVQLFEDLDTASTAALTHLQELLMGLQSYWGEALDPTQLKDIQSRLNDISTQLSQRNPFKAIRDGLKQINLLNQKYGSLEDVETRLIAATRQLTQSKAALTAALSAEAAAQKAYDDAVAEDGADSERAESAKMTLSAAKSLVAAQSQIVDKTTQQIEELSKVQGQYKQSNNSIASGISALGSYVDKVKEAQDAIKGAVESWTNLADDEMWNVVFEGLDKLATSAQQGGEAVASYFKGDYFTMVTKGIASIANLVAGIGTLFNGYKVARANREIKKQKNILEQLQYAYDRLNSAADKLFGKDYLSNYNTQMANLKAQQTAYLKQAEAEASKGKKRDQEAYEGYLKSAQETADKIRELQDDMVSRMMGTDRASAAKEFAESWLEAKATFASTTDAIKSKYKDMIKSMIVEGAAAKVIDSILAPMWQQVQSLLENNANDPTKAIDYVAKNLDAFTNQANTAMETLWKALEARGYDLKELIGDTDSESTGIAKNVASATSEEINALTAAINTAFYYFSPIPLIAENVAAIRQQIVGTTTATQVISGSGEVDANALVQQHLACLPNIEANTAMTVQKMQDTINMLSRVISPKGTNSTHGVNVYLRN